MFAFFRELIHNITSKHHFVEGRGSKVFAVGEYILTLRLASELADLWVGYVNLRTQGVLSSNQSVPNNKRDQPNSEPGSKVFAVGEYTHALRLENKLSDFRAEYVNLCTQGVLSSNLYTPNNKTDQPNGEPGSKVFAVGEYILTLRLASELADLWVGYVNLRTQGVLSSNQSVPNNKRDQPRGWSLLLAGVARFELTNEGVKVPCLTAWRYPYKFSLTILP